MFITFEGIEGSGKSTVLTRVQEHLETQGYDVVLTRASPAAAAWGASCCARSCWTSRATT